MTDDLISRAEAIAAIQAAGGGYIMAMEVISALPAADVSSPLGAVAMRDAAALELEHFKNSVIEAKKRDGSEKQRWTAEEVSSEVRALSRHIQGRIAAIPLPTHADMLAHAMRLPEVAAICDLLREAAGDLTEYVDAEYPLCEHALYPSIAKRHFRDMELVRRINAALEAKP